MSLRLFILILVLLRPALEPAEALLLRAERFLARESFISARTAADEAAALAERSADRERLARAQRVLANALDGLGDSKQASARRSDALAIARDLGDRALEAGMLADAGLGHYQRAEYAEAELDLRMALDLQRASGDGRGEAATRRALARIPFKQGRYDEALAAFQVVLEAETQAGDRKGQAETLLSIALLRTELRSFKAAVDDANRALALQDSLGDPAGRVEVLCKIAAIFLFQDAPGEAQVRLDAALAIAESERDASLRAKVLHHIAGARQEAGRHQEALDAYDEAFLAMENEGNLREAAWVLVRRGKSLSALDRLDEAEDSYIRALAIWERIHERRPLAFHYYGLGRLQERRGDDEAALRSLRRALEKEEAVRLPYVSLVLSDMALLTQRRGDDRQGLELAERAVKAADETGNPEMMWSATHSLGRLHKNAGRKLAALSALRRSLEIIESMRDGVARSDEARAGFMESKQDAYADTVSVLFDLGRFEEGLETAERARARAFVDLLSSRSTPAKQGEAETRLLLRGGPNGSPGRAPTLLAPAPLAEVRREAARFGSTIVVYFAGEDDLFTWVTEPGGSIRSVRTPLGRSKLEARILELEAALEHGPFTAPRTGKAFDASEAPLRQLHRDLIEPIHRWLPADPGHLVTIVPHGPLFRLAFGALIDPQNRRVAETHTLHYTPAVSVLRYTESGRPLSRRTAGVRLLAVGAPSMMRDDTGATRLADLPASAEEARSIASSWPAGRATLLTGDAAREASLRELAPGSDVIHLASHAVVFDKKPLESYVALSKGAAGAAPSAADDGTLTVSEVFDLELRADLVTLSACDTGRGRITGDGVMGLSRAFISAGASSVVVSLWRVADVVAQFQMERFYEALLKGVDKSAALRQAQLDTLAALRRGEIVTPDGRAMLPAPALWAPFVLVGEPR